MEQMFQALIDRSRGPLDVKKIQTILGSKRCPPRRARRKKKVAWEVVLERPVYDLTIFKLRCGLFTLKIYTKGERVLRVETIAHNVKKLPCGCSLQFPAVVAQLQSILKRFMDTLGCVFSERCHSGTTAGALAVGEDQGGRHRFQPTTDTLGSASGIISGVFPRWLFRISIGAASPHSGATKRI
jgi:hypothetical protein